MLSSKDHESNCRAADSRSDQTAFTAIDAVGAGAVEQRVPVHLLITNGRIGDDIVEV